MLLKLPIQDCTKIAHPDMVVMNDKVHIVWADKSDSTRSCTNCSIAIHAPLDATATTDGTITAIDDTVISKSAKQRLAPIDVDSQGNLHIVWQDNYDDLNRFFNQPQIYYSMLQPDIASSSVITLFDDTLLILLSVTRTP